MPKKNYSLLKVHAEELYVEHGLNLTRIGQQLGLAPNTLTNWKNDGDWETLKDYHQNAPHRIERKLNKLMEQIIDGVDEFGNKLTKDEIVERIGKADAVSKIKPALALLNRDVNPSVVYSVLVKLDNYSSQNYPDLAIKNLELHRAFMQHVANNG